MTIGSSDTVLERIARTVSAQTGLRFSASAIDTESAIRRAMMRAGVTDLQRFATLLESDRLVLDDLADEFTVGETYFFREPGQFDFIRNDVFSDVVGRRGPDHAVRIWSAGCATGEEAYSLAIALIDAELQGHVLATDLSRRALQRARNATYRRWSLRGLDESMVRRCFREAGNLWTLDRRFRAPVRFAFHNLARGQYPSVPAGLWGMDVILCRNVLIYFDPDTVRRVARHLSETLADGGWLITGPSDPPLDGVASLSTVVTPHGILYRKAPTDDAATAASGGIHVLTETERVLARLGTARPAGPRDTPAPAQSSVPDVLAAARAAFDAGEYGHVLGLTTHVGDDAAAALRVRALANRDGSARALAELDGLIERFSLSLELHLLGAVLRIERSCYDEAIRSLRRVLYLDRSLVIAHFLLATALARQGRLDEARRSYRNARRLAMERDRDDRLALADGERAGTIADLADAELGVIEAQPAEAS